mmetsp:Transcript_23042/g.55072  ORF Transcript_23042/g.55072 Transcript_23042/m.55072 type:complete len:111 (+) Transcript_23042:25-357(+)|eukprot:CAMPEP_0180137450 /NCGR_PEP_ID=MMETSP0986-20121125/12219_1 /TAXON_ID=697907 /ORGANISM="non described non described, Strain CCMP2293" /LENGTH=110 /DNA_ID=CAMNT_0022078913 /DNA_START=20 /DNA_END=352 /DNA_ORIENTATION=-
MGGSTHLSFTMGILMAAGGTFAFVKKRSVPSLIGGLSAGALFMGSGLLLQKGQNKNGHMLALATSLLLVGGMGPRAVASKKFMPAGLVASIGAVSAAYQTKKVMEWWEEA